MSIHTRAIVMRSAELPGMVADLYWLNKFFNVPPNLTLVIPATPPSMNNYLKHTTHGTYKSAAAVKFQTLVESVFREHQATHTRNWMSIPIPVGVCIRLRIAPNTRMDVDNHAKVLNDALTGLVWDDDAQIQALYISKVILKPAPKQLVRDVLQTTIKVWI